jgi:hypothetical protein
MSDLDSIFSDIAEAVTNVVSSIITLSRKKSFGECYEEQKVYEKILVVYFEPLSKYYKASCL